MITFYKPNSKNSGCGCSFNIGNDQKSNSRFFINMIRQYSWDDKTKNGSFSANRDNPEHTLTAMFNEVECGEMLHAIWYRQTWKGYHTTDKGNTQIQLGYDKEKGFSLSMKKSSQEKNLFISLSTGEIQVLRVILERAIVSAYNSSNAKAKT